MYFSLPVLNIGGNLCDRAVDASLEFFVFKLGTDSANCSMPSALKGRSWQFCNIFHSLGRRNECTQNDEIMEFSQKFAEKRYRSDLTSLVCYV